MPGYEHTTLSSAAAYLALRLSDSPQRFYTQPELYGSIRESLRIWNLLTSHDRARGTFPTAPSTAFYSLPAVLRDATATLLRPQTLTDATLVSEIRHHLLEDNLATDMFTTPQIVDALQWARDQLIADTSVVLTERADVMTAGDGVLDYPDTVVGIRRAVWATASGRFTTLSRSDERTATAFARDWRTASTPRAYSVSASPSLRVRLIPPPVEEGTLHTWTTSSGPVFDPNQTAPTLLGVPDDLAFAVKWGAISTLLGSDGPGSNADGAMRADRLYQMGVQLALKLPTVLYAEIDGVPVIPASIHATDRFQNGWEGRSASSPRVLSILGPDVVALTPLPNASPHSVTLDVVRNALVPQLAGDYLQIGREQLGAVLGMAQWLCVFKCGGEELQTADEYFEAFFAEAQHYAFQRSAASSAISTMQLTGTQQTREAAPEVDPSEGVRNADEIRQERNARRRATT